MAQSLPLPVPFGERVQVAGTRLRAHFAAEWLAWLSFVGVVGLTLWINAWQLADNGWGNTYYAAAVRSMSGSWHNFFFGAFDPGGFITVDKPPFFLWVGALSARIFGYSSWSILLPSAVAGAATTGLVWAIVRRYFGLLTATIAALVFAFTPISVAVDRLNLPEPFFILALVAAAWAILRSLESRRWWYWTAAAGVLVGIAFNTKMLAGWIPGPALALALVVGDSDGWRLGIRRTAGRLAVLAAATFIVSASWMLIVDAWPASDRPYIGGSTDNTVQNLVLDYNGIGRVDGEDRPGPGGGQRPGGNAGAQQNNTRPQGNNGTGRNPGGVVPNGTQPGQGTNITPGNPNQGVPGVPNAQGRTGQPQGPGAFNGPGGIIAGAPGLWRMFDSANGGQIAWFLPFALLGSILCLWQWRRDRIRRAAVILFAGWVLLFGLIFSYAEGIYHSYYTSALAPGVAVLVGMTVAAGSSLVRRHYLWIVPLAGIAIVTTLVQFDLAERFPGFRDDFKPFAPVVLAVGFGVIAGAAIVARFGGKSGLHISPAAGLAVVVGGLLLLPASWATYEVTNGSMNTTLPQAGPRQGAAGRSFGSQAFDNGTATLASWLESNRTADTRWDLAVSSAMNASTLIAEYGLSVMPIGGFSGGDPTITAAQFADMVEKGEVRYVLLGGGGPGGGPGFNIGRGQQGIPAANGNPGGFGPNQGVPSQGTQGQQGTVPGAGRNGTRGANGPTTNNVPGGTVPNRGAQGVPNQGVPNGQPGQQTFPGGVPNITPGGTQTTGANVVMAAARNACTPVSGAGVPAQYQGQLYDCAGAAAKLRGA